MTNCNAQQLRFPKNKEKRSSCAVRSVLRVVRMARREGDAVCCSERLRDKNEEWTEGPKEDGVWMDRFGGPPNIDMYTQNGSERI
ncbi:unnamed protein product [Gongylonema pulchrum]|uniref:Uncharacterized protein n=1 Tax=Gongylonema pulchrum TaxID=637853 RepID=A0A183DYP2_9BILA|nr:unnamed protein product [Gongylonema pulchrum]